MDFETTELLIIDYTRGGRVTEMPYDPEWVDHLSQFPDEDYIVWERRRLAGRSRR